VRRRRSRFHHPIVAALARLGQLDAQTSAAGSRRWTETRTGGRRLTASGKDGDPGRPRTPRRRASIRGRPGLRGPPHHTSAYLARCGPADWPDGGGRASAPSTAAAPDIPRDEALPRTPDGGSPVPARTVPQIPRRPRFLGGPGAVVDVANTSSPSPRRPRRRPPPSGKPASPTQRAAERTMDELIFERLLEDGAFFAPAGADHRAVEIRAPPAGAEPQVRETVLAEKQLGPWCRDARFDADGELFRLLVCSPRVLDRDIWPLPFTSATLGTMVRVLSVPPLFPRAVCRHIPIATSFESPEGGDRAGILLRTNLSHTWQYALAVVRDPDARTTTAVLLGLRGNEVDEVLQAVRRLARHLPACPALLPCILMDRALDALVRDAEERRRNLTQIRIETGSHGFRRGSLNLASSPWDDRDDLDLDVLMQKLTSLSDACAGIDAVCKMQALFVDTVASFVAAGAPAETPPAPPGSAAGASSAVAAPASAPAPAGTGARLARQQLRFFTQFLHGVESKVAYTGHSVRDQIKTIHTLIAQRDSRSQVDLARTSRRLAELSRKDSTDMRVISAVTLVFLPATFTSTFFSASFFDFAPGASVVSRWVWLYWVVTALLMALVLGGWWFFSRRTLRKEREALRRASRARQAGVERYEMRLAAGEDEIEAGDGEGEGAEPLGRWDKFRPYLGGSIAEGMFARKGESIRGRPRPLLSRAACGRASVF